MPTPSGLLKEGDKIEYVEEHIVCTVKERRGNSLSDYSVVLTRDDGELFSKTTWPYVAKEHLLTEAHYWVFSTNRWRLVNQRKRDMKHA